MHPEYIYIGNHTSIKIEKIITWSFDEEDHTIYITTTNHYTWRVQDPVLLQQILRNLTEYVQRA